MNKQLALNIFKGRHGGRRPDSGRKRLKSKGVSHRPREKVNGRTPLHINFKYKIQIKNKVYLKILKGAIINARGMGLRVLHFSLQHNHVHLIVEATNNEILTAGMRSLTVTMAKRIGKGKIQMERFHLHVLKTFREVKNALSYVLFNEQRHHKKKISRIDGYTSLLSLANALPLIRSYAMKEKVTLVVSSMEDFSELSIGKSFLYNKALLFEA